MAAVSGMIRRRLRRDDRGAVAIIVALLLGSGVLLGMGALVVDVGQIYQERAELQNGADAAALAVAKSCALGTCDPAVAATAADGNASGLTGDTEGVSQVCGSGDLGPCPAGDGSITDCLPQPDAGTNFAEVYTITKLPDGSTLLPPVFAATLPGNAGYHGTTVHACAQAEWGAPGSATTLGLTISACTWDQATQQGASFAQEPPYPPDQEPASSADQVLTLGPGSGSGCATEPAGADGPGTFGWIAGARDDCTEFISGSFPERGSGDTPMSCADALQYAQQNEIPELVPIYVAAQGNEYTLRGFAYFVITGYSFPDVGMLAPDWLNPANSCSATQYCLTGYFVQGVIPDTGTVSGTYLGASVVDLTG